MLTRHLSRTYYLNTFNYFNITVLMITQKLRFKNYLSHLAKIILKFCVNSDVKSIQIGLNIMYIVKCLLHILIFG